MIKTNIFFFLSQSFLSHMLSLSKGDVMSSNSTGERWHEFSPENKNTILIGRITAFLLLYYTCEKMLVKTIGKNYF